MTTATVNFISDKLLNVLRKTKDQVTITRLNFCLEQMQTDFDQRKNYIPIINLWGRTKYDPDNETELGEVTIENDNRKGETAKPGTLYITVYLEHNNPEQCVFLRWTAPFSEFNSIKKPLQQDLVLTVMQNLAQETDPILKRIRGAINGKTEIHIQQMQTKKINQKMKELYQQLKTQGLNSAEINTKMLKLLIQELSKWQ